MNIITIRKMMNQAGTSELNYIKVQDIAGEEIVQIYEGDWYDGKKVKLLNKDGIHFLDVPVVTWCPIEKDGKICGLLFNVLFEK